MKKLFLLTVMSLLAVLTHAAGIENWVKLDATNFKDANFRAVIKAAAGTKYNSTTNEVDVNAITAISLTSTDGRKVQSTHGIQLCKNLNTLTLQAPAAKVTIALKEIDVSGLPELTKITNNTKGQRGWPYTLTGSNSVSITNVPSLVSNFTMSNEISVIARDCPKLTYVNLARYSKLVKFDCTGSDKIEELYLIYTGIKSLDISNLHALKNTSMNGVWSDNLYTTNMMSGMTDYRHMSLYGCSSLTSLTVGDIPLHYLDVSGCNNLDNVDLSRMPNLLRFHGIMSSKQTLAPPYNVTSEFSDNGHTHPEYSGGILKNLILPEKTGLGELTVKYCLLSELDLVQAGKSLVYLDLSYNKFREFNMSLIEKATQIILSFNRIRHLDMPPTTCTTLGITDNCLTRYGQLYNGGYTKTTCQNMYQYLRVGDVYRYKILDDPEKEKDYIELDNDPNSQKYYYGINGNELSGRIHIGDSSKDEKDYNGVPTGRKEDPCYIYFDNDYSDGIYFYRNPTSNSTHGIHGWMKIYLCRGSDEDVDPATLQYYLAGDFNGWQPTERDHFEYSGSDHLHYLTYNDESIIERNFRVWGINPDAPMPSGKKEIYDTKDVSTAVHPQPGQHYYTVDDAMVDYGASQDDYDSVDDYKGYNSHVLVNSKVHHKMSFDPQRHFTSYLPETVARATTTWKRTGFKNSAFEMRADGLESPENYLMLVYSKTTGVDDILADDNDADAPVEYYDLQGRRTQPDTPGLYLRRQGRTVTKVVM